MFIFAFFIVLFMDSAGAPVIAPVPDIAQMIQLLMREADAKAEERQRRLEEGQKDLATKIASVEEGQKDLTAKIASVEEGQKEAKEDRKNMAAEIKAIRDDLTTDITALTAEVKDNKKDLAALTTTIEENKKVLTTEIADSRKRLEKQGRDFTAKLNTMKESVLGDVTGESEEEEDEGEDKEEKTGGKRE